MLWTLKTNMSDNMDGTRGYYAKWNKPDRARQIYHMIPLICGIWKTKKRNKTVTDL